VEFLRGEHVEVSSDRPFMMYADGDPIGELPVSLSVERQALRVITPEPGA
jgi:diacylglycerol kinase family enzyme